jgi:hypothetical protein
MKELQLFRHRILILYAQAQVESVGENNLFRIFITQPLSSFPLAILTIISFTPFLRNPFTFLSAAPSYPLRPLSVLWRVDPLLCKDREKGA